MTPMSEEELQRVEARLRALGEEPNWNSRRYRFIETVIEQDAPRLIAEVRRLREENTGLDAAVSSLEASVYALMEPPR